MFITPIHDLSLKSSEEISLNDASVNKLLAEPLAPNKEWFNYVYQSPQQKISSVESYERPSTLQHR